MTDKKLRKDAEMLDELAKRSKAKVKLVEVPKENLCKECHFLKVDPAIGSSCVLEKSRRKCADFNGLEGAARFMIYKEEEADELAKENS